MLRFIGAVTLIVGLMVAGLYFTDNLSLSGDVSVTKKGRQNFNDGVSVVQGGVNNGLNSLKSESKTEE